MELTDTIVNFLSENGIEFECGNFYSYGDIDKYFSTSINNYCTGIELQGKMIPLTSEHFKQSYIK